MKITYVAIAAIFLLFAAVQVNDPDWLYWMTIYLAVMSVAFAAIMDRFYPKWTLLTIGAVIISAIQVFPSFLDWLGSDDKAMLFDEFAKMQFPYVEETREFIGLLIALASLLLIYLRRPIANS